MLILEALNSPEIYYEYNSMFNKNHHIFYI